MGQGSKFLSDDRTNHGHDARRMEGERRTPKIGLTRNGWIAITVKEESDCFGGADQQAVAVRPHRDRVSSALSAATSHPSNQPGLMGLVKDWSRYTDSK